MLLRGDAGYLASVDVNDEILCRLHRGLDVSPYGVTFLSDIAREYAGGFSMGSLWAAGLVEVATLGVKRGPGRSD